MQCILHTHTQCSKFKVTVQLEMFFGEFVRQSPIRHLRIAYQGYITYIAINRFGSSSFHFTFSGLWNFFLRSLSKRTIHFLLKTYFIGGKIWKSTKPNNLLSLMRTYLPNVSTDYPPSFHVHVEYILLFISHLYLSNPNLFFKIFTLHDRTSLVMHFYRKCVFSTLKVSISCNTFSSFKF